MDHATQTCGVVEAVARVCRTGNHTANLSKEQLEHQSIPHRVQRFAVAFLVS